MSRRGPSRTGQSPASFEPLERRALMSAAVDLTIADAGFSDAAKQPPPVPGARFYIQPTLQENGQAPARPLPFSIYLSPTPTLTDQSIRIYSRADGDLTIWSGPTWKAEASGNLPSEVTPGTWYPIVIVDPDNTIPESNETNNTFVADPVTVILPDDDLTAPAVFTSVDWVAGTTVGITGPYDDIARQYPVTIGYALSADDVAGNADDIPLWTETSPPTDCWHPGGPMAQVVGCYLPSRGFALPADLPPGQYHLVTIVDPDNAIAEPDETNNTALGPAIALLPADTIDYKPLNISSPATATPGLKIDVGAYAYSVFGQETHPPMSFVLSADDIAGNGDDILLGSYNTNVQIPLPPGVVCMYYGPAPTLSVTLPSDLAPGQYKLFAVVDHDNQITEYDETNNVSPATDLTITQPTPAPTPVDLTVANTGFAPPAGDPQTNPGGAPVFIPLPPPPANPGAHFSITPTLLENGLTPDRSLPYAIYLSPTPTLTDQSVLIFSGTTPQYDTPTGPIWIADATGTLPPSITPGTWYPIVIVDPDNLIPESDESNNTLVANPITVALPHDELMPPTSSASATAVAGQPITIYSDFGQPNNRQYPATIAYSLSSDDIAGNADDILLGTTTDPYFSGWHAGFFVYAGEILYPAGWIGNPTTFTLPANLPPGTYHLVTTIDPDNVITEPNETNNSLLGPTITILPADSPDQPSPSQPTNQAPLASSPIFRNVTPRSTLRTPITLTNPTGHRRTGTYKITLYLSTDDQLSRNDKPFSTQTLTATLRPHHTQTRRLTYKLPPSARHGHHFVFATVTPIHPTHLTAPTSPTPTPLNILQKHHPLHSRPISKQLLDSNQPQP